MRLILDTAILVSGIRSPSGASNLLLRMGLRREFDWLLSVPLFLEYEAVLCRHEHLQASGFDISEVANLLDEVLNVATQVILQQPVSFTVPDQDDRHVFTLAAEGAADAVVTHNLKHFRALPEMLGVKLYSPAQALSAMRGLR